MAMKQSFVCDICGAERKDANHWFVARETDGMLMFLHWDEAAICRANTAHLCGQSCAHKALDRFLAQEINNKN